MNFDQRVKIYYDSFTESEKDMIFYISNHKKEVIDLSAVDFGEKMLSSKSSVSRLSKKMGYRGYTEMKYAIENELYFTTLNPTDLVADLKENIEKTFNYANQVNFQPLLDKLKNAEKVMIYATGFTQNNYSKEFSNDLFLSSRPNFLISGETNFDMISHTLTQKDLVIITSLSGNTPAIQNTIKFLNLNKIPLCSVTLFGKSFLSDYSDFQLYYEGSSLPSPVMEGSVSMIGLNIILSILSNKYREFVLFDE